MRVDVSGQRDGIGDHDVRLFQIHPVRWHMLSLPSTVRFIAARDGGRGNHFYVGSARPRFSVRSKCYAVWQRRIVRQALPRSS